MGLIFGVFSMAALAGARGYGNHGHWQRGYGGGWMWVISAIVGGTIIYGATQPQQQTIVVQPMTDPNCSPWTEIQNQDGTITRTRTCANKTMLIIQVK